MLGYLLPPRDHSPKLNHGGAILASPTFAFFRLKWTSMSPKRPLFNAQKGLRWLVVMGIVALGATGCEDGTTEPDFNPGFMVGDWLAETLVMTSVANPDVTADLLALGAVFTLSVQPSGRYTAILEGGGQSSSESGRLTVDGAEVVLMPESPAGPESRALWDRVGDSVILAGDSEFDFNLDLVPEPATLRQVLIPN
jgi:hypothetical protein